MTSNTAMLGLGGSMDINIKPMGDTSLIMGALGKPGRLSGVIKEAIHVMFKSSIMLLLLPCLPSELNSNANKSSRESNS